MPGSEIKPVNPLDAYSEMYKKAAEVKPTEAPKFNLDPKVLGEVSSSMDFTKGIPPELLTKALAGDAQSLLQAMNFVGQRSYQNSLEHAAALTDSHLTARGDYDKARINSGVDQKLTSSALSSLPNYSNPIVREELNRIASSFRAANPDASHQEIALAAQKYLQDISNAVNSTPSSASKKDEPTDWASYLTS
jgi:hypothetical protein